MLKNKFKYFLIFCIILFVFNILSTSIVKTAGELLVFVNNQQVKQGTFLIIKADKNQVKKIRFNQVEYSFNQDKKSGLSICLIPVSYWLNSGNYKLEIIGDDLITSREIEVLSGDFVESHITVDSSQEEIIRPQNEEIIERKEEDNAKIREARQKSTSEKQWQGNFTWPVEGTITTTFGATRYVNGILNNRHSGIDIAAPRGNPVSAAADGIVKLSTDLLVTGNTIIIDHGWYVFSSYSHLDCLNVSVGELVNKGDIIGTVGSTGVSTGPHLHWALTIHGVFVDPEGFVNMGEFHF
ncbi:MAG TPA: M23 family metallopeptidase [Halanaerobiales bacterium]|nr:M23 family metallopeptidase [Halanaerobiales bacterium]